MYRFEILIVESHISNVDDSYTSNNRLTYMLPDEATDLLEPIFARYDQSPFWYFDRLSSGKPPAPWALVCLDKEYSLAGHIVTSRPRDAGIKFSAYTQVPQPIPDDFYPGVGVLAFAHKEGLILSAENSLIFDQAMQALDKCSVNKNWLIILDPLPDYWLNEIIPSDRDKWFSRE